MGSPSSIKGFLTDAVSPIGVKPYPTVALVGLDRDPVLENGDPDILASLIFAGEREAAVSLGGHKFVHTAKVIGVKNNPRLPVLYLGRTCGVFHSGPPLLVVNCLRL